MRAEIDKSTKDDPNSGEPVTAAPEIERLRRRISELGGPQPRSGTSGRNRRTDRSA